MRAQSRPLALLLAAACCAGCGYALVGTAGRVTVLPPEVQVIALLPFENRTSRPEIEQRVTEEVAREFSKRRRYRIVTERAGADAVLEGAVTYFRTDPVQFNEAGRYTRVETVVSLQATIRNATSDEIIWSQDRLLFREQWDVPETEGEFFDEETLALGRIARGAAGTLVSSVLEGF